MPDRPYPDSYYTLGPTLRRRWRRPWLGTKGLTLKQRRRYRRALNAAGLITPNFSWRAARCHDGTWVPRLLRANAIKHAWNLERFRHAIGDRPIYVMSWYRTRSHNKAVGGAIFSKHLWAIATDFSKATIDSIGRNRWNATADRVFANGGVGSYPSGSGHLDSRGYRARWSDFVGW